MGNDELHALDGDSEDHMDPPPDYLPKFPGNGRLRDKVALVSGGDSGIGRAICVLFAREGADVALIYHENDSDARETADLIGAEGREALIIKGDLGQSEFCDDAISQTIKRFGRLSVLVNNAAEQHMRESLADISDEQLRRTFDTNVFGYFFLTRAALPHLKAGDAIVNTSSVTAYRGSPHLLDYSSTRGAIVSFTRSLAGQLAGQGIRVNAVAPGPIWTPLVASTTPAEELKKFGKDQPLGRPGQPNEVATCHLFLACAESAYMTGQVLHPNGGEIIGG